MSTYEPSGDEKKNGWTKKELNKYLKERELAQFDDLHVIHKEAPPPIRQNNDYNPLKWR